MKTQNQFFFLRWTSNAPKKADFHTLNGNIFKHVCVKGNTINKTNGTEGLDNLNEKHNVS